MRTFRLKTLLAALWLLQSAILGFAAAVETAPVGGFAYPRVSAAWAGSLPAAFSELAAAPHGVDAATMGSLSKLDLKTAEQRQSMAPVVEALSIALELTPEKFLALKPADRAGALSMAIEDAQTRLEQRVRALAGQAKDSAWTVRPGDREAQAKLYHLLADLGEIRRFYGPLLSEESRASVGKSYELANARALEIREALVRQAGKGLEAPDAAAPAKAPAQIVEFPKPSATAEKLLEDMKRTRSGWGLDDFRTVYKGYGFIETQGGKHVKFTHSVFPELVQHVSRGRSLAPGYAVDAVKMIERLQKLQAERAPPVSTAGTAAAPREIPLSELSFLLERPAIEIPGKTATSRRHARKAAVSDKREVVVEAAPAAAEKPALAPEEVPVSVAGAPEPVMTLQPATAREDVAKPGLPAPAAQEETPASSKRSWGNRLFGWIRRGKS